MDKDKNMGDEEDLTNDEQLKALHLDKVEEIEVRVHEELGGGRKAERKTLWITTILSFLTIIGVGLFLYYTGWQGI
ncbi:unnamed protein product [marine sediment metagenome]|uniref:Uncharacterized protein n=1 Tax=marine sediment metagenome TaxID=412755 RepID=X1S8S2_9ZZZZ